MLRKVIWLVVNNQKHIPLDNFNFQKMYCINKGHPEQKRGNSVPKKFCGNVM